jgi:hypothetical protein
MNMFYWKETLIIHHQWLRLALPNRPKSACTPPPTQLFTRGWKHPVSEMLCSVQNMRWWTKSRNPLILILIYSLELVRTHYVKNCTKRNNLIVKGYNISQKYQNNHITLKKYIWSKLHCDCCSLCYLLGITLCQAINVLPMFHLDEEDSRLLWNVWRIFVPWHGAVLKGRGDDWRMYNW